MVPDIVISMPHPPPLVCKEGWVQNKCGHVPILSVSCIVCQVRIWRKVQQQGEGGGVHIMKRKRIRLFWESTLWKERESETILGMGTNLSSGFTPQIFLFLFSWIRASSSSPSIVLSSCLNHKCKSILKAASSYFAYAGTYVSKSVAVSCSELCTVFIDGSTLLFFSLKKILSQKWNYDSMNWSA